MQRRRFLTSFASAGALVLAAPLARRARADECGPRTEPNIEGPFHRPGAPARSVLAEHGRLIVTGRVLGRGCRPLAGAVLDVWHADADGDYDLQGFSLRGQLRTDAAGGYRLETLYPGRYRAGGMIRPAHIHVKVHANGHAPLTTQLYFPGDPHNESDPWFRSSLQLRFAPMGCCSPQRRPRPAHFDFVL